MFALALGAGVGVVGLVAPGTPVGLRLRDALGAWTILAPVWPAWLAWLLVREGRLPPVRLVAYLALSTSALVLGALADGRSGGNLGTSMLRLLDLGFGRIGGLAVLVCVALAGGLAALGMERLLRLLAFLGVATWHVAAPRERDGGGERPRRRESEPKPEPASPAHEPTPPAHDIVILGPRHASAGAEGHKTPPPALAPAPTPRDVRPVAPGQMVWTRPEPTLLAMSSDGGAFSPAELKKRARVIEETLESFNILARVAEVQQGPAITQFGIDPAPGVAVSRIVSRQNDLALRLGAPSLRVLAPVPGRSLVGIEVPNTSVATVKLGDLLPAPMFGKARLPIGVGMDVSGKPVVADLTRMPHLLIAGATGSGKSVCINSLIASVLVSRSPDDVQLVLIDPKQVEMSQYKGLPHLRLPVVTDMDKVVATLRWTVLEMERRYTRFSEVGARNIVAFNEKMPQERLSYLVIVVDELADMMMTAAEDVERLICRLAQLGRAAGVHLIVATQRPSVDVLTGLIKANLPTRIAFAVSSAVDSRVILDHAGAERLLGRGDALYQAGDEMNPRRVQGSFVSDDEIEALCNHWRAQALPRHTAEDEALLEQLARQHDPEEKLLAEAREIFAEKDGAVSVSYLQRHLHVGFQKAARIHQTLMADEAASHSLPPPEYADV